MFELAERGPPKATLAERLTNYFTYVPEVSREQFLLEAVANEIDRREQTLNGGKPFPSAQDQAPPHPRTTERPVAPDL